MKRIKGDLIKLAINGSFDVIIHGCNCYCAMGAGLAKKIKTEFPEAYAADKATIKGDLSKLGTYSSIEYFVTNTPNPFQKVTIVNGYTQAGYGSTKLNADYEAIRSLFKSIKIDYSGSRIGYPLIGCGLAGGDWNIVKEIIDEELAGEDHTVVTLYEPLNPTDNNQCIF